LTADFKKNYEGKVAVLDADHLAKAIRDYEIIQEISGKLGSYAQLCFAKNMADSAITQFYQNTQEKLTTLSSKILFFMLSINKLEDAHLSAMKGNAALEKYGPWIRDVRAFRPYQLSDDLEKLLHEKSVAGRAAWTRLFDETIAGLRFPIGGKKLTEPEA